MSEIGTGLQNATGIRDGIARAGYAFVEASDMRNALARFGTLGRLAGLRRRAGTTSRSTPTWPMAAATGAGAATCRCAGRQGAIVRRPAPAALPDARLQPAERRRRALVRADRPTRSATAPAMRTDPGILPRAVRSAGARRRARWHVEVAPVPHRGARRASRDSRRPKGMHRDGVDYVLVLLINRRNIASGTTTMHDARQAARSAASP